MSINCYLRHQFRLRIMQFNPLHDRRLASLLFLLLFFGYGKLQQSVFSVHHSSEQHFWFYTINPHLICISMATRGLEQQQQQQGHWKSLYFIHSWVGIVVGRTICFFLLNCKQTPSECPSSNGLHTRFGWPQERGHVVVGQVGNIFWGSKEPLQCTLLLSGSCYRCFYFIKVTLLGLFVFLLSLPKIRFLFSLSITSCTLSVELRISYQVSR